MAPNQASRGAGGPRLDGNFTKGWRIEPVQARQDRRGGEAVVHPEDVGTRLHQGFLDARVAHPELENAAAGVVDPQTQELSATDAERG